MSEWTWDRWLALAIAIPDFFLWCAILKMTLGARWEEQAEQTRLAKKARLDREKRQAFRRGVQA